MGGISSSVGLISGIDTATLIGQLLAIEARPQIAAQQRIIQLQTQQTAFLDLNSRLGALRTAAQAFNTNFLFSGANASSSNEEALTATASAGAALGTYTFTVDSLVSTHQLLTRGFADRSNSALGLDSIILESERGRLDRDTDLAELNGGTGVRRGEIIVTDASGASATVDLSRAASVNEVLDAINSAGGIQVQASIADNAISITDLSGGGGVVTVNNGAGFTTATDLGLTSLTQNGSRFTGSELYQLGDNTRLSELNDGNGVRINRTIGEYPAGSDFTIQTRDGSLYQIDLGEILESVEDPENPGQQILEATGPAVVTIADLRERVESLTEGKVTVEINPADNRSIRLVDSTSGGSDFEIAAIGDSDAAADLGILGSTTGSTIEGSAIFATLNSVLLDSLNGGSGVGGTGTLDFTARDGTNFVIDVSSATSVQDLINIINDDASNAGRIVVGLDATGTGLSVTDTTGGSQNLIIQGDTATDLGIETDPAGVASATVSGSRLQRQYVSGATLLSSLNGGDGVGTGEFEITDANGASATVNIGTDSATIDDIIAEINGAGVAVTARINDNGDGIVVEADPGAGGSLAISITDTSGTVAGSLNLASTAEDPTTLNAIDGSFERTINFEVTDTLDDVVSTINDANAGVSVSIINDGNPSAPYRLTFASRTSGQAGRFTIDTGGFDLGISSLSEGRDARVFFGSDDPATAILLRANSNTVDDVIDGVDLDLQSTTDQPVTVSVSRDVEGIITAVDTLITAFNDIVERIDAVSDFDEETEQRGILLGDSTTQQLRTAMFSTLQRQAIGVSGPFQFLSQVGVTIGSGGTVELDRDRLREALAQDPDAVRDLFAAKDIAEREPIEILPGITVNNTDPDTFTAQGVAEQIAEFAKRYVDPIDGILTGRRNTISSQIAAQEDRIDDIQARLDRRRATLEAQFASLEQVLAGLNSQQSALGLLG